MPARRCERAKCCERSRRDRNLQVAICRVVLRPADDAQKLAPPPCTAIGSGALLSNVGAQNTATGSQALLSNTTGSENTADGYQALLAATTGADNTGIGRQALLSNMTGSGNTAIGLDILADNTAGSNNIAVGMEPACLSPQEITISTSATQVAVVSPIPFASVTARRAPSSLESLGYRLQGRPSW